MIKSKILTVLIIILVLTSALSALLINTVKANPPETNYPPILNPIQEMRFQIEQDIVLEISSVDFNLDDELTLTAESIEGSPNPLENGASIFFTSREQDLWKWQFNWRPTQAHLFDQTGERIPKYKFLAKVQDLSGEYTQLEITINLDDLNQREFIATPTLTTNPYYATIIDNKPFFPASYIRTNQVISISTLSHSSTLSNLEYQFKNGNTILQDWGTSNTAAFSSPIPQTYNIAVQARSANSPQTVSETSQIAISVKDNAEVLPPRIQIATPKQINTATFDFTFYSNPENRNIQSYTLKIGKLNTPPNELIEIANIPVPDPENEHLIYNIEYDLTSNPEILELLRTLLNGGAPLNILKVELTASTPNEQPYTRFIIFNTNFPSATNIQIDNITQTTADIRVEATNPENLYDIQSFKIYKQSGELITEFPANQQPYTLTNLQPNIFYRNEFYIRPVHRANNIELEGVAKTLPEFQTAIDPSVFTWQLINNDLPLDTEPQHFSQVISQTFSSLKTENYIYFTYKTASFKDVISRFNIQENKFEVWTGESWSSSENALPEPISHSMSSYTNIKILPFPEDENSLLGTAVALYRTDNNVMDTHGTAVNFKFQGNQFKQWNGGTNYESFFFKSLIDSWSGSGGDNLDFAFNPTTKKGIAIGTVGRYALTNPPYERQLTAAFYDHNDISNVWYRWNNNQWIPNANWPSSTVQAGQPVWILNPSIPDASIYNYEKPIISYIPQTEDFLVTFIYDSNNLNTALYKGTEGKWYHWTNNKWQHGAPYNYSPLNANFRITNKKLTQLSEQKVSLIFLENGNLYEKIYDNQVQIPNQQITGSWSETSVISDERFSIEEFVLNKDSEDTLYLVYKGRTSNIYLTKKPLNEEWTAPEILYAFSEETHLAGIEFTNQNVPVLFINKKTENGRGRLYALSVPDSFWQTTEIFNVNSLPREQSLNTNLISHNSFNKPRVQETGHALGPAGNIAISQDNYIYSPQSTAFSTLITKINQQNFAESTSKTWGNFGGYFSFPGGADIYEARNTVYISNKLVSPNGGSSLQTDGLITAWKYSPETRDIRNENLFQNTFGIASRQPLESYTYGEQRFSDGLAWPGDVTVDDVRGLLIISDSANNRLKIYDIENLIDLPTNANQNYFLRQNFLTAVSNSQNIIEIENALIREGYVGSSTIQGQERIYWITNNEQETLNFVRSLPAWQSISADIHKGRVLQVLSTSFKTYRQVPQFVNYIGEEGFELGQFKFPQAHDIGPDGSLYIVDSENHRIQKFQFNSTINNYEPVLAWGTRGKDQGEFTSPIGISVDKLYNVVFVTDPLNDRIQIFSHDGEFITEFSSWTENNERKYLSNNVGIAAKDGKFYLANENKIEKFSLVDNPPEFSNVNIIQQENNFDLEIHANDDWGITHLTVLIDNETFQEVEIDYERNLQTTITIPLQNLTGHVITIIAKDAIAQQTQTQIVNGNPPDLTPPEVFNLIPQQGTTFTLGTTIEISAEVIDNVEVDNVTALILQPDLTTLRFDLTNTAGNKYTTSFTPGILGNYEIIFIAIDTSSNINSEKTTSFTVIQQTSPPNQGGGGGGGGNRGSRTIPPQNPPQNISLQQCTENWLCEPWSQCANNIQTRTCYDINNCGTFNNAPTQERTCFTPTQTTPEESFFSRAKTTALAIFNLNKLTATQKLATTLTLIVIISIIALTTLAKRRRKS